MHPVIYALIWVGLAGLVVATLSANAADAMAEQERRKGDADRDAPALLNIVTFVLPVGRCFNIFSVFTDWYSAYRSPVIRHLTYVARGGLIVGALFPVMIMFVVLGLDAALRP